jgi:hypothetical protein
MIPTSRFLCGVAASIALWGTGGAALAATCASGEGPDCSLSFAESGTVRISFIGSNGGFDHRFFLDGAATPLFQGASGDPGTWTLAPSAPGSFVDIAYTGGTELVFRLDGIGTTRIGGIDPQAVGTLATSVFTGSRTGDSIGVDLGGGPHLSYVRGVGTSTLNVAMSDLFGEAAANAASIGNFEFQLALAPVPEPHEWAMMIAGLGLVGWATRRRRGDPALPA